MNIDLSFIRDFFMQRNHLQAMCMIAAAVFAMGLFIATIASRCFGDKNEKIIIRMGMILTGVALCVGIAGLKLQEQLPK